MNTDLHKLQVPSVIAQRRDDFLSPEFRWLVAALRQITRPLDRRNLAAMVEAFNRIAEITVSSEQIIAEDETTGRSYLVTWLDTAGTQALDTVGANLLRLLSGPANDPAAIKTALESILTEFKQRPTGTDQGSDL